MNEEQNDSATTDNSLDSQPFEYYKVGIVVKDNEYEVGALLDMTDDEFTVVYKDYQQEMSKKPENVLGSLGMLTMINSMEHIALERRVRRLEQLM